MKPRHHLYLDETLTEQLEVLAAKPGASKSAIVSAALRAYLGRRGAAALDDVLKARLDRFSGQLNRMERDQRVLLETLALFIRHFFMVTPSPSEGELAALRALAEIRFQNFITEVGRQIGPAKPVAQDGPDRRSPIADPAAAGMASERSVA
jgi:predicted transcriptional regulator